MTSEAIFGTMNYGQVSHLLSGRETTNLGHSDFLESTLGLEFVDLQQSQNASSEYTNKYLVGCTENQETGAFNFGAGFCDVRDDSAYQSVSKYHV